MLDANQLKEVDNLFFYCSVKILLNIILFPGRNGWEAGGQRGQSSAVWPGTPSGKKSFSFKPLSTKKFVFSQIFLPKGVAINQNKLFFEIGHRYEDRESFVFLYIFVLALFEKPTIALAWNMQNSYLF